MHARAPTPSRISHSHAFTLGFKNRFGRCAAAEPSPNIEATRRRIRLSPTPRGCRRSAITCHHIIVFRFSFCRLLAIGTAFLLPRFLDSQNTVTESQICANIRQLTTGSRMERRATMTSSSKNGNRDSRPVTRPIRPNVLQFNRTI